MSSRTFTLEEAQDLVPVLESLLRTAIDGKKLIEAVEAESQELAQRIFMSGGMSLNVVAITGRKAQREKALQRVKDAMAEIDAMGVQVKDLDIGLLDFPCEVDGQVVLVATARYYDYAQGVAVAPPVPGHAGTGIVCCST